MSWRFLKYFSAYSIPLVAVFSLQSDGWLSFSALLYAFGFIPVLEFLLPLKKESKLQAEMLAADRIYDWLLYLIVPVQLLVMIWFLNISASAAPTTLSFWGHVSAMGVMCGVLGINVAHELGHRRNPMEQLLAKILLFTSLYPHFFIEHNYGHHRKVATPEDPASARKGESLYHFWWRSVTGSYRSAWRIEGDRLKRKKHSWWSCHNEMLVYSAIELMLLTGILWVWGLTATLAFVIAAAMGILLLETVNYIEHYGLRREKLSARRYENTQLEHSWNSDHLLGRVMLFELSRHSDHHAHPHKKYQHLSSDVRSPQMPTGYPGMMLLSLIPPLWFSVMHKRIEKNSSPDLVK